MTINCNGILLNLDSPQVMGVININSDSFYSGSRATTMEEIITKAKIMLEEGASIIDIGAMSSRPGASLINPEDEIKILKPIVVELKKFVPILSIDTVWSSTANLMINQGANMINDISAGSIDDEMMKVVAKQKNIPYIIMHMKGSPETMNSLTNYDNFLDEVLIYFAKKIRLALDLGIKDIILDPGFGFAKNLEQNYELLSKMNILSVFGNPLIAGISRKSMLYKLLDISPEDALNATSVANTIALVKGAKILRVHDVKQAVQAVKIFNSLTPNL